MSNIKLEEKYERKGWPSVARPDLKPPAGWSLPLLSSVALIDGHELSPDGQQITFTWNRDETSDVYRMPAAGGWPLRLTTGRELDWPDLACRWSPDGQWLAISKNSHIYVAPASGGLPRKITDFTTSASDPVWMPDGRLIISVEQQDSVRLLLTDRDGRWPRELAGSADGDCWDAQPSPDGSLVVYTFRPFADLNRLDIHVVEVQTGQIRELMGRPKLRNWHGRWSPDGQQIAFLSQQSGWNEVWLVRTNGEGTGQLTHLGADVNDLAWSPDGTRLAATINRGGALHLALIDAQTGEATTLRGDEGVYSRPLWSPGGDWLLVYYEDPLLPPDLYRVDLDGKRHQLTFSNPPALAANHFPQPDSFRPERISYKSFDGLEIPAFLYQPQQSNGAAIVYPHGGPNLQAVLAWEPMIPYFAAKGYTWLKPNYRGSTGYGVAFEHANYNDWGGGDTQDCLHAARYLRELPGIHPERIAIYGASYGGYMVACCLSRDPDYLFACGVDKFGDADLISSWAQCNRDLRLYSQIFLDHPARNRQAYIDGSPIYQVENVQKPQLIFHGLEDTVVPPQASEEWVEALRRAGKTFEYKTYAGEGHGFLQIAHQQDFYQRMERFLDWYLLP